VCTAHGRDECASVVVLCVHKAQSRLPHHCAGDTHFTGTEHVQVRTQHLTPIPQPIPQPMRHATPNPCEWHITPKCITSHHRTSHHITSHHSAAQYSTAAHHITPHHSTAHHTTAQHSTAHHTITWITSHITSQYSERRQRKGGEGKREERGRAGRTPPTGSTENVKPLVAGDGSALHHTPANSCSNCSNLDG
jgi:hypothetical protein